MIHYTRWKPDTCDCDLTYAWDDQDAPDERSHNFEEVHNKCAAHAGVPDQDVFETIIAENQNKNKAVEAAAVAAGIEARDVVFSLDENRKLTLELPVVDLEPVREALALAEGVEAEVLDA